MVDLEEVVDKVVAASIPEEATKHRKRKRADQEPEILSVHTIHGIGMQGRAGAMMVKAGAQQHEKDRVVLKWRERGVLIDRDRNGTQEQLLVPWANIREIKVVEE